MFHNQSVLTMTNKDSRHCFDDFNLKLSSLFSSPPSERNCAIVVTNSSSPDEGINAGNLLEIDFTKNTIEHDGLYVITIDDEWIGYRRFQLMPDLRIVSGGEASSVPSGMMKSLKVVGLVKRVYRS